MTNWGWGKLKDNWQHLKDLPIEAPVQTREVQLLIGTCDADVFAATSAAVVGRPGEPVATPTPLGWIVAGRTHCQPKRSVTRQQHLNNLSLCQNAEAVTCTMVHHMENAAELRHLTQVTNFSELHQLNTLADAESRVNQEEDVSDSAGIIKGTDNVDTRSAQPSETEIIQKLALENKELKRSMERLFTNKHEEEDCRLRNMESPAWTTRLEQSAQERFNRNAKYDGNKYTVGLIWGDPKRKIPYN